MDFSNNCQKLPSILLKTETDFLNSVKQPIEFETDDVFLETLNVDSDENDDDSESETNPKYEDFIETCYEKLWEQMSPVDDENLIRKVVMKEGVEEHVEDNSIISVHYMGYCEHSKEPIAFTDENNPEIIDMKGEKHLIGLLMALKSMKIGETSRFLLSHKVMYGQYGCPPLIPPKAMCLFTISVSTVLPSVESNGDKEENQTTFQKVYKVAREVYVKGVFYYKKTEYNHAAKTFSTSVRLMEYCRLADQCEEDKQQKFLSKLYTNLAICYLKLNMPLKTCCMCNELNYLGKLWNNSKALLQNARALSMLGEYGKAEKRIKAAQSLDPQSDELVKELQNIQQKRALADKNRRILENNTEFSLKLKQSNPQDNVAATSSSVTDFVNSAEHYCKYFSDNTELCKTSLPAGLTKTESEIVIDAAKKYNLFYQCENDIVVSISKMEINNQVDIIGEDDK